MDVYNYGCSVLVDKFIVPAFNQLYDVRLLVTAVVKFHHFDGVAVI